MKTADSLEETVRALVGPAELTPAEVARAAGVELQLARRLWRALGFPPVADEERFFAPSDAAILRATADLMRRQGAQGDVILQMTRVVGQSMARIAEAQLAAAAAHLPSDDGAAAASIDALTSAGEALLPDVEPFLGYVWRRHLVAALRRFSAQADAAGAEPNQLAIGFADLVGFTAMSQQLSTNELAALVNRFEEIAYESIPQGGGRVIKMIGDAVMFAAESARAAASIALDLVALHAAEEDLPDVRVGLAYGPTLSWQGDLFGPTVNLASRLVSLARPGTVLISTAAADQVEGDSSFALRRLRPVRLKGLGRVAVTVLRRPAA